MSRKPQLTFNRGLTLIGFRTTGPEHLAKWYDQWNRKFPEFPKISGKRTTGCPYIWFCTANLGWSRPYNLENTSGRNFDWSMKTMVPWRSWQKGHEETPTTNLFACGQLATDHPCQGTFVTQRAVRTFNVSMAFWPRIFRNLRSELTRKKIFLANVIRLQLQLFDR